MTILAKTTLFYTGDETLGDETIKKESTTTASKDHPLHRHTSIFPVSRRATYQYREEGWHRPSCP